MEMGARVSEIGSLLGDPVRAAMLTALMDGRSLLAGELAFIGNVAPQTASFHLGKLLESHLIAVERQGKHRYYRLTNEQVALALESLASIAPLRNEAHARSYRHLSQHRNTGLQFARSCYRHLAGRLAIQIHDALIVCGFVLSVGERQYELTEEGECWLMKLASSKDGSVSRRERGGQACLDWTERHHHRRAARRYVVLPPDRSWLATTAAGNARAGRHAQRPRGSGPATWGAVNRQTITSFSWVGSDARSSLTGVVTANEYGGSNPLPGSMSALACWHQLRLVSVSKADLRGRVPKCRG
jgi:DNA-binding transcriptional ArsR family regulator